jgi:hypothetical protein
MLAKIENKLYKKLVYLIGPNWSTLQCQKKPKAILQKYKMLQEHEKHYRRKGNLKLITMRLSSVVNSM